MMAGGLFQRESHLNFPLSEAPTPPEVPPLARAFGLALTEERLPRIEKKSRNSDLYVLSDDAGRRFVLRVFPAREEELAEARCRVLLRCQGLPILLPIALPSGRLVARSGDHAASLFPWFSGHPFDGEPEFMEPAIRSALSVLPAMGGTEEPVAEIRHSPGDWFRFLREFLDRERGREPLFSRWISPDLLEKRLLTIISTEKTAAPAFENLNALPRRIVHNDLNHANVLRDGNDFLVVDMEDIVREIPAVAVAHGVFKLSRHVVFRNPSLLGEVTGTLRKKIIPNLVTAGFVSSGSELREASLFRILSDVFGILNHTAATNDDCFLYDLAKRLDNVPESELLFKEAA